MGIFPFARNTPLLITIGVILSGIAWLATILPRLGSRKIWSPLLIFLVLLILFFNSMMSVTMHTWGPYYYGSFWSIFFILYLAQILKESRLPILALSACFFLIIISTANCFVGINSVYKKYHYYPYNPGEIRLYFEGQKFYYDPKDHSLFIGKDLKEDVLVYWTLVRNSIIIEPFNLPKELCWLPTELEPTVDHERYNLLSDNPKDNIPLLTAH